MAIKFERVKVGDTLWDYHSERAGNTTMRRWGNWPVQVVRIREDGSGAYCRWNQNPERFWSRRQVERLRRKPGPERGYR
jgi:hypothetical protein